MMDVIALDGEQVLVTPDRRRLVQGGIIGPSDAACQTQANDAFGGATA
jgi:hypothetical protein